MKQITKNVSKIFFMLLIITSTFSTSCKKDDEKDQSADYVGIWSSDIIDATEEFDEYKNLLTLTTKSFDNIILTQNSAGTWINSIQVKGSMTVTGNKMNIHVNEIGVSKIDEGTGDFTGIMESYQEGSLFFGIIMSQINKDVDFQSEYTINGNKLTLKTDVNDDGDYADENESVVYTRQ